MPRRSRRRIVGKWEQIEREARENELRDLERDLHADRKDEPEGKPRPKRRQPKQKPTKPHQSGNEPESENGCASG